MPEDHPDPRLLERFMRNEAGGEERRWIVRHLLAGCARCGAITRRLWDLGEARPEIPAAERRKERPAFPREPEEPAMTAASLHRLAVLLAEGGRGEMALEALRKARPLYERLGDRPNLSRLRHLEGTIAAASGSPGEAEAALLDARRGFLGEGLGDEAAAALLDLAVLYTREGRAPEILPHAQDMLPIFRTPGLRKGVAAALVYFRHLAESGQGSAELLSEMARYVGPLPRERRL